MKNFLDSLKGYRTMIAAVVVSCAGIYAQIGADPVVGPWLKDHFGSVMTTLGVVFGILRYITTGPVGKSGGDGAP